MLELAELIVNQICVDFGIVQKGTGYGEEHHIVEGDLAQTKSLAACLEGSAEVHQGSCIEGCVQSQLSHLGQRCVHLTGDYAANTGERLFVICANVVGYNTGGLSLNRFIGSIVGNNGIACEECLNSSNVCHKAGIQCCIDITLNDTSVRAGGSDFRHINAGLKRKVLCAGGDADQLACLNRCGGNHGSSGGLNFFNGSGSFSSCLLCGCGCNQCGDILSGFADDADIFQTRNHVALLEQDCKHCTAYLCGLVESGLVGLVREQQIAFSDGVSDFLVPCGDDAAFYALSLAGHNHGLCHMNLSFRCVYIGTGRAGSHQIIYCSFVTSIMRPPWR